MNQILIVKKNKPIYRVQLYLSIVCIIVFIIGFLVYKYNLNKKEKISKTLLNNYNISKIYTNVNLDENYEDDEIVGIIEIPKIDISYPFFSNIREDLLKISPCRFSGQMPNSASNLCIAGHNYDNNKFFSNLNKLNVNDYIFIYNNSGTKFSYIVNDKYEISENELYSIYPSTNIPTLTLVTCNNKNNKRLIVKAKEDVVK